MQKAVQLLPHGAIDSGGAMAGVQAADTAGEIDEAIAVHIFEHSAFGFRDKHRSGVGNSRAARHCAALQSAFDFGPGTRSVIEWCHFEIVGY